MKTVPLYTQICFLGFLVLFSGESVATKRRLIAEVHEEEILPFTVSLPLPNETELDQFLEDLYNPLHKNYRKFLTPKQFTAQFGPTNKQVSKIRSILEANSFVFNNISDNRLLIHASGHAKDVNKFFQIQLAHYLDEESGLVILSHESSPTLPTEIRGVFGLDNSTCFRRKSLKKTELSVRQKRDLLNGRKLNSGLTPSEIKLAYEVPTNLHGKTQTFLGLPSF